MFTSGNWYSEAWTKGLTFCKQHFWCTLLQQYFSILINIWLRIAPKHPIDNKLPLFQVMAWWQAITWTNGYPVHRPIFSVNWKIVHFPNGPRVCLQMHGTEVANVRKKLPLAQIITCIHECVLKEMGRSKISISTLNRHPYPLLPSPYQHTGDTDDVGCSWHHQS